jgi:hypothetical protein
MELERTGNHHAALTRNVPLGPVNDVSHFARHDPMRLPDAHLRRNDMTVGAVTAEREGLNRARNYDNTFLESYQRSKPGRGVVPRKRMKETVHGLQEEKMRQTTGDTSRNIGTETIVYKSTPRSEKNTISPSAKQAFQQPPSREGVSTRYPPTGDRLPTSPIVEDYDSDDAGQHNRALYGLVQRPHLSASSTIVEGYDSDGSGKHNRTSHELVRRPRSPSPLSSKVVTYARSPPTAARVLEETASIGDSDAIVRRSRREEEFGRRERAPYYEQPTLEEARRVGITYPQLNHTKSAPTQTHLPEFAPYVRPVADPHRAYSMQEPADGEEFRPAPMRRAKKMPPQINASQSNAHANAYDYEATTPDGHRAEVNEPVAMAGSRRNLLTNELLGCFTCRLRRKKCEEGRPSCKACHDLGLRCAYKRPMWWSDGEQRRLQKERIKDIIKQTQMSKKGTGSTSYVYGAQGSRDVSASRPTLGRNESARSAAPHPQQLYGEIPTTSRPSRRQTRTNFRADPAAERQKAFKAWQNMNNAKDKDRAQQQQQSRYALASSQAQAKTASPPEDNASRRDSEAVGMPGGRGRGFGGFSDPKGIFAEFLKGGGAGMGGAGGDDLPEEDSRIAPEDRPLARLRYNPSHRDSEAVRPTYARDPFDGWHSDYDHAPRDSEEIGKAPERRAVPLQTPSPRLRSELICPTVSRDETSSEGVKNSTYIKMAMEPHVRKARMSKVSRLDTPSLVRPKKTSVKRNTEGVWPSYTRNPTVHTGEVYRGPTRNLTITNQ